MIGSIIVAFLLIFFVIIPAITIPLAFLGYMLDHRQRAGESWSEMMRKRRPQ